MQEYLPERRLHGGLRLPAGKESSTRGPIRRQFAPSHVVIGLADGREPPAEPVVAVGDHVVRGQIIARGKAGTTAAHASVAGRIAAIDEQPLPGASRIDTMPAITIESLPAPGTVRTLGDWPRDRQAQIDRIAEGGIVGLGGARFPTAIKVSAAGCRTLIVNGAECEPYISCDDMLIREAAADIVAGSAVLAEVVGADRTIIAIERDKPAAIEAMRAALDADAGGGIRLAEIPTIYPAGGERQLIDVLTGVEIPAGRYPSDAGFVCQNVGTAHAVARLALHGEPLTSRIVTVTGDAIADAGNVDVPLGAPIAELLDYCGGFAGEPAALIHGGSMMGYALPSDALHVTQATNCLIVAAADELKPITREWPCIRCGECATACPVRLMPQDLLVAARTGAQDSLTDLALDDCIECGCCDVACPSLIPLTATFRRAKVAVRAARDRDALSTLSAERYERHEHRTRTRAEREARFQEALKAEVDDPEARRRAIADAVARARRKRTTARGEAE